MDRVARGEDEDRHRRATAAEAAGDVQPGAIRQADVEDQRIEAAGLGEPEAITGGRRDLDDVAVGVEQTLEHAGEAAVVLDDEQVHPPDGARRS